MIDELPSGDLEKVSADFFRPLQRGKQLELFRFPDGKYLVTVDGIQYFSSDSIHCPNCLAKNLRTGDTVWHHQAVCAALVHPDNRQVIPIAPEPVMPVDGRSKQDCEINAGKRLIEKIRRAHPKLDIVIAGDSLYSKQPFVDLLKEKGMSFIPMAKHGDHKVLFEWVSEFRRMGEIRRLEVRHFAVGVFEAHFQGVVAVEYREELRSSAPEIFFDDGSVDRFGDSPTDWVVDVFDEGVVRKGRAPEFAS